MELNLMEATEKDGDPTDLWVTLEAMGYDRMLELVDVCMNLCSHYALTWITLERSDFTDF